MHVPPYQKGGLGVFVRGITNKFDRRMTILALDLLLEMRAVSPGMLAIAGGLLVWNLGIRGGSFSANALPTVRFVANQSARGVLVAGEKKRDPSRTGQGQEML